MAAPIVNNRKFYDANLGDILQDVKRVDLFLDVVFEFLYRRTDFYKIMEHENDVMGLPPGVARKLVIQAYMKYDSIAHGHPSVPPESKPDASIGEVTAVENVIEVETESEKPPEELESGLVELAEKAQIKEIKEEARTTDDKDKKVNRSDGRMLTAADTYNGAGQENYCWSQTLADVDLKIYVPETLRKGKELKVVIKNKSITVTSIQGDILIDSVLVNEVHSEECMWSLHPGHYVQLTLEKKVQTWWKSVFAGEPEIDQKSIDNTVNIHDMDSDSQADYDRVMFDMEQKRQGKPTIKELETNEMLKKAWNAEGSPFAGTEFDPSIVNVST